MEITISASAKILLMIKSYTNIFFICLIVLFASGCQNSESFSVSMGHHDGLGHGDNVNQPINYVVPPLNIDRVKNLLGVRVLGYDAWRRLGITVTISGRAIGDPNISDRMYEEISRALEIGYVPIVLLDPLFNIQQMEQLILTARGRLFTPDSTHLGRERSSYSAPNIDRPRWVLFFLDDAGLLPGSRNMTCQDQINFMYLNYRGYRMGTPRELVMAVILARSEGFDLFSGVNARCAFRYSNTDGQLVDEVSVFGNPRRINNPENNILDFELFARLRYNPIDPFLGLFAVFVDDPNIAELYIPPINRWRISIPVPFWGWIRII